MQGLPVEDGIAAGVFCSHVLEHLSRSDFDKAIANSFRMLKPGGRFRLVVPDLEARTRLYLEAKATRSAHANDRLLRSLGMGTEQRPRSLGQRLRAAFGNSAHLWMWDYEGIEAALATAGFDRIRRCAFRDSGDPMFDAIERQDRFFDGDLGITECAVEARKPQAASVCSAASPSAEPLNAATRRM